MEVASGCICASDPLWVDLLWSILGLIIGVMLGYLLHAKKETKK